MTRLTRRLTTIPLAARVLLLGAVITAALTVVATAMEPGQTPAPAATQTQQDAGTSAATQGATSSATSDIEVRQLADPNEGAIPKPPADVQAPQEETRHANNSRFTMPLRTGFTVTDRFGAPRGNGLIHGGIDLALDTHTPVFASCKGTVIEANFSSVYGYHAVVDCGDLYTTLYAHFSELRVSVGQAVTTDHVLGMSGSTGFSTGEHLHFEIHWSGVHVNPEDYLDFHIAPGTPLSSGPIVWGRTTQGGPTGSGGAGTLPIGGPGGDSTAAPDASPTEQDPTSTGTATSTATSTATATNVPPTATATPTATPTNTPTPTPTPMPPTPTRTPTPKPIIR